MRVIVLGTGAMACLFGAKLASVAQVTLLGTWPEALTALETQGIVVNDAGSRATVRVASARLTVNIAPADLVLVLVKAWQTRRVAAYLPTLAQHRGTILTLQNGIGNLEQLGPRACLGVTTMGATLEGPGHVHVGGRGPTHVAAPAWVVGLLRDAGFEAYEATDADVESLAWGKLAVNCALNPLTAILRVRNGQLLQRPSAAIVLERSVHECAQVAQAKGVALPFGDPLEHVYEVARRTELNTSSMLQDVLRGAPTEIDMINGAVVREGERLGVATQVNDLLWRLVKAMGPSS